MSQELKKSTAEMEKRKFKRMMGYLEIMVVKYKDGNHYAISIDGVDDEMLLLLIGLMEKAKRMILEGKGLTDIGHPEKRTPFWRKREVEE